VIIQLWLTQFDRGELNDEEAEANVIGENEARMAALERQVGQLTMELDLTKNSAPADRRRQREVLHHHRPTTCSIKPGCEVIDLPKSTFCCRATIRTAKISDAELVSLIEDITYELPC
jgi:hypothetical protein